MNKEKIKEDVLTALKIKEEIQNIFKKHDVMISCSGNDSNAYFNQTDECLEGFICEYYYGSPNKIYTPLGYIKIWDGSISGGKNHDDAIKEIEDVFGLVLKERELKTSIGVIGGWYYITELPWNNTNLRCDCIERTKDSYIERNEAKKLYKEIFREYNCKK